MTKKRWNSQQYSDEDETILIRMFNEYYSLSDIALAVSRSRDSVVVKVKKLKLKRNYKLVSIVATHGLEVLSGDVSGLLSPKCKRGHPFTSENTYHYFYETNGRKYRRCKTCRKLNSKLKYRIDPMYREKELNRSRVNKQGSVSGTDNKRAGS